MSEYDPFNPTQEEIQQFILLYGDENGQVDEAVFADYLSGNLDLKMPTDSDTEKADEPADEESRPSEDDDGKEVATADAGAEAADQGDDDPGEKEPVVQAKDGEHTIPYSVVEELREEVKALKSQNAEFKELLEHNNKEIEAKLETAASQDAAAGNTDASQALFEELEEDYPGITGKLQSAFSVLIDAKVQDLLADKEQRDKESARESAQQDYNAKAQQLDERYEATIANDAFWKWFDQQPGIIRQAETSGDPQHFVEVMAMYYKEQDAPAPKKTVSPDDVAAKVKEAVTKADKRQTVTSLSDVPGGSNPAHDEVQALLNMSSLDLAASLLELGDPSKIEAKIARLV